jgi:hypothetical protein
MLLLLASTFKPEGNSVDPGIPCRTIEAEIRQPGIFRPCRSCEWLAFPRTFDAASSKAEGFVRGSAESASFVQSTHSRSVDEERHYRELERRRAAISDSSEHLERCGHGSRHDDFAEHKISGHTSAPTPRRLETNAKAPAALAAGARYLQTQFELGSVWYGSPNVTLLELGVPRRAERQIGDHPSLLDGGLVSETEPILDLPCGKIPRGRRSGRTLSSCLLGGRLTTLLCRKCETPGLLRHLI